MRPSYLGFWKNYHWLLTLKQETLISLESSRHQLSWCVVKAISRFICGHLFSVSSHARRGKGLPGDKCPFTWALIAFMSTAPWQPITSPSPCLLMPQLEIRFWCMNLRGPEQILNVQVLRRLQKNMFPLKPAVSGYKQESHWDIPLAQSFKSKLWNEILKMIFTL